MAEIGFPIALTPEEERDLLARAIRDAAVRAGACREDIELTTPKLLLLLDDMADALVRAKAIIGKEGGSSE